MRRCIYLFLLIQGVIGVMGVYAQTKGNVEAVFPYNFPSKEAIFNLASSNTPKGIAYAKQMLKAVNNGLRHADTSYRISSIDEISSNLFYEDVTLPEGDYINSGFNTTTLQMKESVGHKWSGFAWVYKIGSISIILFKGDCGNVVIVAVIKAKTQPVNPTAIGYVPPPRDVTGYVSAPRQYTPPVKPLPTLKNKFPWGWVVAGAVVGGGVAYELLKKKPIAGGPGGAPSTTGGDTGGPGGAPSTTNVSPMNPFVLNRTMTVPKSVVFVPMRANTAIGFGISKHGASASFTFNF
jgi:hypothetical protein